MVGICIMFNAVVLLTNAMMQAHGHAVIPVINMFVGGIVKLILVYILTGNRNIGILGTPLGTAACYLCITILNLISMGRCVSEPPAIVRNLVRPFLAAAIMGLCAWGAWFALTSLGITSRLILCALPVMVGVVVYVVAAVVLKVITRDDCMLLPKGEKIARLLRL